MTLDKKILLITAILSIPIISVANASRPYYSPDLDEDEYVDF